MAPTEWKELKVQLKDLLDNGFIRLSRPKTGREWHPHLSYYVSEPTNLNPNISNIINRK